MSTIPFFLITGFLGSGKTTLLKHLIDTWSETKKLAIVQNEFAPGTVDGTELRQSGKYFELLEVNKGSVFCVCLLSDFIPSLRAFIDETQPDAVVLEATGLADPIAVAQVIGAGELQTSLYLAHVWCVIDGGTFLKQLPAITRIAHQVRVADTVVLNKSDTMTDGNAVRTRIAQLNPFARIEETSWCAIDTTAIFTPISIIPVAKRRELDHTAFESCGRPTIGSAVLRVNVPVLLENLTRFISIYEPKTIRLKGYVTLTDKRVVMVQSCFGSTDITFINNYNGASELIAMGDNISQKEFVRDFTTCCGI